jgi:TPR repeat protein
VKASRLYSKWAEAGNADAQHSLAEMYLRGEGVGKDLEEGSRWFRKAEKVYRDLAQRGDARAAGALGLMYLRGEGVTKNTSEGVRWLREAAENGDLLPVNSLAWALATCKDPETRDGAFAVYFAERAAAASGRKDAGVLDTLACAYAENGQFAEAVKVQKEAIALLQSGMRTFDRLHTLDDYTSHLQLFEAKLPYHQDD